MNETSFQQQAKDLLKNIYGERKLEERADRLFSLVKNWGEKEWKKDKALTEKNVYLITYGDSIQKEGMPPLAALQTFINEHAKEEVTDIHLLPMFPYTSDDGFSVVDYRQIDSSLGNWSDIENLSKDYRLMFDFVANHMSKKSEWFQGYLNGNPQYQEYFIPKQEGFDASQTVRPRTSPLYHSYRSGSEEKTAWTTFSEDQVDLNFKHFPVLLEMTDILLMYAHRGGSSIRLDAIGFLWKESGTSSIHLPQTHAIIQLWRLILEYFGQETLLITETNVPHRENVSYLGNGENEAHMVYQFPLPPLVLHTLTAHNSDKLSSWAKSINKVSEKASYFNFLASHDGIGMRPTEGILTEEERQTLVDKVKSNGGRVSYKSNSDGTQSPYELNINYMEALINQDEDEGEAVHVQKMLAAHSILFSFIGVPAVYYHSLFGSTNDEAGAASSGINRRINREKFDYDVLMEDLHTYSRRRSVFNGLKKMINLRQGESALSPFAEQQVLDLGREVFALKRYNGESGDRLFFAVNVSNSRVSVDIPFAGRDLWSGASLEGTAELEPYQFIWVK